MHDSNQKINNIAWLNQMGVEYFFSEKPKVTMKKASNVTAARGRLQGAKQSRKTDESLATGSPSFARDDDKCSNNSISSARALADKSATLQELKQNIDSFDGCKLKVLATNTVFADGNPSAKIMFIGEAPGASEDAAGIPFCGESGKLLDNILASVNISRATNAYITNTVFWRPPANRTPTQEEIDICRPFVEKHIALIAPKLIVLVGSTAATSLLGKHEGISKIRQTYYSYTNKYLTSPIPTTAIFHPAYLLRQPLQKKTVWYDLIKIQQFIRENLV